MEEVQAVPQTGTSHALDLRFTGSGNEYFRIWIVNLLLTIITLGLYYPWARVRRLRYFHGNTLVGGHALDFHGEPKKMLRGFLLAGALVLLYSYAGRISPLAGGVAFLAVASFVPALLWAALRFRLANTSWRGMRMRFAGTIGGAYRALAAAVVPFALLVGLGWLSGSPTDDPDQPPRTALAIAAPLVLLLALSLAPLMFWLFKRYQHGNLALGEERSRLGLGPGPFFALSFKVAGVFMLASLALNIGPALAVGLEDLRGRTWALLLLVFGYLIVLAISGAYATSRLQNLLWSNTASARIRFRSALEAMPYIRLAITNAVLVILTLGFYWPYAATATAKMRLEAVAVQLDVSPDELATEWRRDDDAAGDAAGDLFGIDIGF